VKGRTRRAVAAAAVSLFFTAACSMPVTEDALEAKLREAAASVRGLGTNVMVFPIYAGSRMEAWTLATESKQSGPLPIARRLCRQFELAVKKRSVLAVGGPYPALTRAVVLDAIDLAADKRLRGLVLVYVGSAESAGDVRAPASKLGIRLVQRELP